MSARSRLVATFADEQFGVISWAQLKALDVPESTIAGWVRAKWLRRVHRAVFAVGHVALRWEGRLVAAALAGGPGAPASHRAAGAWLALRPSASPIIDVTIPTGRARTKGIRWHRAELPPEEIVEHDGVRVTSVARTLLDLAPARSHTDITKMLVRADRRGAFDVAAIEAACSRVPGHRGRARLLRAVDAYAPELVSTRSGVEVLGFEILRASGFRPLPAINAYVDTDIGVLEVDLVWRRQRAAVEIDTYGTHGTLADFERDRARDQALLRAGWRTMRATDRTLEDHPARFVHSVAALVSRSG